MADQEAPLSFLEAYKHLSEQKITRREYLHHIFLHCLPQWHEDVDYESERSLRVDDPFAYLVFCYQTEITGIADPTPLEEVIHAGERDDVEEVRAKLQALTAATAYCLKSSLALMALQQRKPEILRFCMAPPVQFFDRRYGHGFEDLANGVKKKEDPEMYAIINNSEWRDRCKWRPPGARDIRGE